MSFISFWRVVQGGKSNIALAMLARFICRFLARCFKEKHVSGGAQRRAGSAKTHVSHAVSELSQSATFLDFSWVLELASSVCASNVTGVTAAALGGSMRGQTKQHRQ
eukprot:6091042-Amphidinium_carterae.1